MNRGGNRIMEQKYLQQIEQPESKKKDKRLRWVVVIVITLVAAIIAVAFGITCYQVKKNEEAVKIRKQQEQATEEEIRRRNEYSKKLEQVTYTMLSGAADAESCCNLIRQVWSNAIYEKKDNATDKYTKPNGYFVADFNDALDNLYEDSDFQEQVNNIRENQEIVRSLIKELVNPQEEFKEAYEILVECYDTYLVFTKMAVNPSGSLNTFTDDFDDADTKFMHCYDRMGIYLPDTK